MADWIDYYPWPGIIDFSDVAHLYEKHLISRQRIFEALGISKEELDAADIQRSQDFQRDESS